MTGTVARSPGVVAGLAFLMMPMFLMPLFGFAPTMWAAPRMIGAIGLGVAAALLLCGFGFYVMTAGPWPWFAESRNWLNIMTHISFGTIVAWWYRGRAHPAARIPARDGAQGTRE